MSETTNPLLLICVPTGFDIIRRETFLWACHLSYALGKSGDFSDENVLWLSPTGSRIHVMRNEAVNTARAYGVTHILMVDPDMDVDRYVGQDENAFNFFPSAWAFMKENPGCVLAAPACCGEPDHFVNVFARTEQGGLMRVERESAATLRSWQRVGAVGTSTMLIDMSIFDKISKPYFFDEYQSHEQAGISSTQDVAFCNNCYKHDIPIFVNFNCWGGHKKTVMIEKPGWIPKRDNTVVAPTHYDAARKKSVQVGAMEREFTEWTVSPECWSEISKHLKPGMKTLEAGSGLSTRLFREAGCNHTALEDEEDFLAYGATYCPLKDRPTGLRWYDWEPDGPYDLIFIDGPRGDKGRDGIMDVIDSLVADHTIIVVDDTQRESEMSLAAEIAIRFDREFDTFGGARKFTVIHDKYDDQAEEESQEAVVSARN